MPAGPGGVLGSDSGRDMSSPRSGEHDVEARRVFCYERLCPWCLLGAEHGNMDSAMVQCAAIGQQMGLNDHGISATCVCRTALRWCKNMVDREVARAGSGTDRSWAVSGRSAPRHGAAPLGSGRAAPLAALGSSWSRTEPARVDVTSSHWAWMSEGTSITAGALHLDRPPPGLGCIWRVDDPLAQPLDSWLAHSSEDSSMLRRGADVWRERGPRSTWSGLHAGCDRASLVPFRTSRRTGAGSARSARFGACIPAGD